MAESINRVTLTGNLTRDPELKQAGSTSVCELGVAVNNRKKVKGEWTDHASFLDVVTFGAMAENCAKYLAKGRPVAVDGRFEQQRWETDGQKRSKVVVIAQQVQFLSSGEQRQEQPQADTSGFTPAAQDDTDDIPF